MQIIVLQNQEQFGPFDLDHLQSIVNEGHFQLTDYCWAQEWSEWKLTLDKNILKAGMVVKNESQLVSCDFVTSLAVRGIYVRSKPKGEDFNFSSEAALHVARGAEILGCYNFADITEHLGSGFLLTTDLFWNEPVGEWLELSQIQ